ncbi:hypothetical protein JDV02_008621 [Purpureocillium takamizusanense]|uniref:Rhodopsin domain-containing protein n=1 Tax=Purpureocillium takamizusanense TaxID=2060973 RepID=A0A9Q8VDH7_9HYPO|nr:uncharacterized protein JDV02_008621 [Purpureocillium takamizusanense]UNI22760.1 hypothetical protein JDV02_008621 [Purpureocillium takamizusanense]
MASSEKSPLPGLPGFDPDNLQPWTVQVVASVTTLAVVAVSLRILSRKLKHQPLWLDDGMIVFSLCWNIVVVGFIFAMYSAGMGIHADKVEPGSIVMMAKWLVVAEVLYAWNLGWTKTALLLMYYRIFHLPYFKRMAWIVGAFVWAWVLCITFLFIFICVPVQKLWYQDIPGHCINQVGTWIANAASTILTDLIILLMPLPQIWSLQLRKTEKIGLTLAFCLGFFVVFASAYRTSVLFTYTNTDPTYTLAPTVGWTAIEMSAGIVSACLPTLLPIVLLFLRWCGFKRDPSAIQVDGDMPLTFGGSGSKDSQGSKGGRGKCSCGMDSALRTQNDARGGDTSFYRLPDDTESDSIVSGRVRADGEVPTTYLDSRLRPDVRGHEHTTRSFTSGGHGNTKNNIPMHSIRVDTDFQQSTYKH